MLITLVLCIMAVLSVVTILIALCIAASGMVMVIAPIVFPIIILGVILTSLLRKHK